MQQSSYKRYRGSRKTGKIVAACILAFIIVASIVFLILENYIIYDDQGQKHWEPPTIFKTEAAKDTSSPTEVVVEYKDPEEEKSTLNQVHAYEVTPSCFYKDASEILALSGESLFYDIKDMRGALSFEPSFQVPSEIKINSGKTRENLEESLSSNIHYHIAHVCTLCDGYFVRANSSNALKYTSGTFFYDGNGGYSWLDPSSKEVQQYILSLCQECESMGFDEVVLDYFSYPTSGKLESIAIDSSVDRVEVLNSFAENIREALSDDITLSIVVRSEMGEQFGLSSEMVLTVFDRIYVPSDLDISQLIENFPKTFNEATQIVYMVDEPLSSGSYVQLATN